MQIHFLYLKIREKTISKLIFINKFATNIYLICTDNYTQTINYYLLSSSSKSAGP